jgi:hypothetical protein
VHVISTLFLRKTHFRSKYRQYTVNLLFVKGKMSQMLLKTRE